MKLIILLLLYMLIDDDDDCASVSVASRIDRDRDAIENEIKDINDMRTKNINEQYTANTQLRELRTEEKRSKPSWRSCARRA